MGAGGYVMQNFNNYQASDDELVLRAKTGDREAFNELTLRHRTASLRTAIMVLRDATDAEDVVQDAFSKAFQHIRGFQQGAKFSTWLTRIVLNQCLMRLRRKRLRDWTSLDACPGEGAPAQIASGEPSPEVQLARKQVMEVVWREICRVPPLLRHVFLLRDVEQLPMSDVAARLGISVAAAKSRLLRARAELRDRMQKHCGRLGAATLLAES
jgi:RNA polymerase sigma-70 factor (ECF subfamily)